MFKALNIQTNQEIIILDPQWKHLIHQLRALDQQNLLICQWCKQPVRVRAGEIRTWHFSHKHLTNCPYSHESPIVLQTRAMLYKWLVSKFGENVTLEKEFHNGELPHPIDCWVKSKHDPFAYWIIESTMNPDKRNTIKDILTGIKLIGFL